MERELSRKPHKGQLTIDRNRLAGRGRERSIREDPAERERRICGISLSHLRNVGIAGSAIAISGLILTGCGSMENAQGSMEEAEGIELCVDRDTGVVLEDQLCPEQGNPSPSGSPEVSKDASASPSPASTDGGTLVRVPGQWVYVLPKALADAGITEITPGMELPGGAEALHNPAIAAERPGGLFIIRGFTGFGSRSIGVPHAGSFGG